MVGKQGYQKNKHLSDYAQAISMIHWRLSIMNILHVTYNNGKRYFKNNNILISVPSSEISFFCYEAMWPVLIIDL